MVIWFATTIATHLLPFTHCAMSYDHMVCHNYCHLPCVLCFRYLRLMLMPMLCANEMTHCMSFLIVSSAYKELSVYCNITLLFDPLDGL